MFEKWKELQIETKLSLFALILSLLVLGINETRHYYKQVSDEEMATIRLNLVDLLADNNNLDRPEIIIKYMAEHDDFVEKRKLSQSLYELMKDKIVVYTKATNTYELASYNSIYENKGHTLSIVKNNIAKLLRTPMALTKDQILESYEYKFNYKLTQDQLNNALYEALKDDVIVYNVPSQAYQMRSFNLIDNKALKQGRCLAWRYVWLPTPTKKH